MKKNEMMCFRELVVCILPRFPSHWKILGLLVWRHSPKTHPLPCSCISSLFINIPSHDPSPCEIPLIYTWLDFMGLTDMHELVLGHH